MANERIRFDMTMTDVVVAMSEGNPGAMRTCMELIKEAPTVDPDSGLGALGPLLQLDSLNIWGPRLYMLWNDVCDRDVPAMIAILRANQLGSLSETAINHAIDNRGEGIDLTAIINMVKDRLPGFNA